MQALKLSKYRRGKTNLASALRMIRKDMFKVVIMLRLLQTSNHT